MTSKIDKLSAFMKHTFWWKDKENKQKASKPIIELCWRVEKGVSGVEATLAKKVMKGPSEYCHLS